MNDEEIKRRFSNLLDVQKKAVHRESSITKECGAETFWQETGRQADDPDSYWLLRAFAMMELGIISSEEFYGT